MNRTVLAVMTLTAVAGAASADTPEFEPHQAIVRLRPGASIKKIAADYGVAVGASIPSRGIHLMQLPVGMSEEGFVDDVEEDPRVDWVELNFIGKDPGPGTQSFFLAATESQYRDQPARRIIRLPEAHDTALGTGVLIAVIDSGADAAHPELAGRLQLPGYNFISNNEDISDVGDGLDSDGDMLTDEMVGHGTFAATLASMTAPGAMILPVKVLDSDGRTNAWLVALGMDFALSRGARVVNLSLGTEAPATMLTEMAGWADSAGAVVVASAGNDNLSSPPQYPSFIPEVIAVGATDDDDIKAEFSNFGEHLDLCAPGVGIVSAVPGGYGQASGTSYAAPLVAGAAALILDGDPSASVADVTMRLKQSAASLDEMNPNFIDKLGAGRLDAAAAVGGLGGCYADCDQSTGAGELDFFDFICFQDLFSAGDPYACDCDQSTGPQVCDFFDFICFQDAFSGGC